MRFLLPITFCLFSFFSSAQAIVEFARLGVNEGLSQNSVYAIHQDEQGFLWIGTGDGLNRYDGKGIKIFREKWADTSMQNLPGRMVTSPIYQDREHRLWFCTDKGIVGLDKKTERFIRPSQFSAAIKMWEKEVVPIGIDAFDNLWLFNKSNRLRAIDLNNWQVKTVDLPKSETAYFAFVEEENIFLTTASGLYRFDIKKGSTQKIKDEKNITAFTRISDNKYAIHTPQAILIFHSLSNRFEAFNLFAKEKFSKGSADLMLSCEFPTGVFYLRSPGNGLIRYNEKTGEQHSFTHEAGNPSSLSSNYITTTFIDRSNNLWLGTEGGGLSRIDLKPQKFKSFPSYTVNARQAANLMVKSIATTHQKILIGTFSQGLYVVDKEGNRFHQYTFSDVFPKQIPLSINVLQYDQSGRLWMNMGNAIGYLDTNTFRFKELAYLLPAKGQLEFSSWVYSLLETAPDEFLLGTYYGLYRMTVKNGKITACHSPEDSLLNGHIQSIQKAPDGTIYIGKIRNGFWRIQLTKEGIKVIDKGFLSTGIRHFYFDKQKPLVWMASESGLIVFNTQTKKSQLYDAGNGLSNSYVYSILPENDTTLWVSTNKGINKVLVHHTANGLAGSLAFTPYTQVDGLQSNEFNTGAFYKSKEGELFFGGVNGINWFTGAHVITNHHKPSVVLTDLRINEKGYAAETAISYLNAITLPYDQNTIHLRFASLEFTNANANLYAYQLEGVDKEWIHNASLNEARYANLPPGNYRFKAVGTNSDGVWNETPLEFSIVITPPYWQTLWFKLLVLLTVIFVSGFVLRFYIRTRIRNKLRELEKQQAVNEERLRISRDMHDELGMGLTKIALLSEVTKQHFTKQTNDVAPLQEITATSRHLTEKMGEIIWTLNPKNDTLDNLGAYLKEHLSELSEMASLDLITVYPDQIPNVKVSNRQRQQILLVTKEGFHNIIRHANAKHVVFSMRIEEDVFFTLEDDGIGFEETPAFESPNGKGNGLHNMAWRMKQIGGSLKIHKRKGGGTVLQYRFALTP